MNSKNIESFRSPEEVLQRVAELKRQGFRESDIHVYAKDDSHLQSIRNVETLEEDQDKSLWDRFKEFISGEDTFEDIFDRMGFTEEERSDYMKELEGGAILLYVQGFTHEDTVADDLARDFDREDWTSSDSDAPAPDRRVLEEEIVSGGRAMNTGTAFADVPAPPEEPQGYEKFRTAKDNLQEGLTDLEREMREESLKQPPKESDPLIQEPQELVSSKDESLSADEIRKDPFVQDVLKGDFLRGDLNKIVRDVNRAPVAEQEPMQEKPSKDLGEEAASMRPALEQPSDILQAPQKPMDPLEVPEPQAPPIVLDGETPSPAPIVLGSDRPNEDPMMHPEAKDPTTRPLSFEEELPATQKPELSEPESWEGDATWETLKDPKAAVDQDLPKEEASEDPAKKEWAHTLDAAKAQWDHTSEKAEDELTKIRKDEAMKAEELQQEMHEEDPRKAFKIEGEDFKKDYEDIAREVEEMSGKVAIKPSDLWDENELGLNDPLEKEDPSNHREPFSPS
ncbi:hypothetical protein ABB02_01577 [Clostridiaceae bacterium JG1575]|nr:hypothetical protein ABB02_01577 [Clostridiaceae bacterium JG1575]